VRRARKYPSETAMPPDDLWSFHHDETPGPCVEIDTRLDRETVYAEVVEHLAEHTEPML
jgi:hypothetical protein